jgi:lipopolysaccharide/colanic/teichoic acid biosynthesis glycosyltransferase
LILLLPFFLTVAPLVKFDTVGPAFFQQVRWGMNGRKMVVYRFRSMRSELCDPTGILQTVERDRRVTWIGAILRKTNIDELPQLFNVVRGDMSLVASRHPVNMRAAGKLYEELGSGNHHAM